MFTATKVNETGFLFAKNKITNQLETIALTPHVQVGLSNAPAGLTLTGELSLSFAEKTLTSGQSYQVPKTTSVVNVKTTSGSGTIGVVLPSSPRVGQVVFVKDGSSTAGTVNVTVSGALSTHLVDGVTSKTLSTNDESIQLVWNGTGWMTFGVAGGGGGGSPSGPAGGDLTGTYPNPTIAALAVTDAKVAAANKDGTAATPSMRTLGTGATQACAGNDSRLSDSRAPTGAAGGDLTGTYPNPTVDGLQGRSVSSTAPSSGDVLTWNGFFWLPVAPSGGSPTGAAGGDLNGTYPNPTVDGLQGRAVSSTAPTAGQVLAWNGSVWIPTTVPPSRLVSLDSNDLLAWDFTESSAPWANTGTGGTLDMTSFSDYSKTVNPTKGGSLFSGYYIRAEQSYGRTPTTTVGELTTLSLHGWYRPLNLNGSYYGKVFGKDDSTYVFHPIGIYILSTGGDPTYYEVMVIITTTSGQANIGTWTSNTVLGNNMARSCSVQWNQWNHVGVTVENESGDSRVKVYVNGRYSYNTLATGLIDWTSYTNGRWTIGGPGAYNNGGDYSHWRVCDTVRSADYFDEVYRRGVNWYY